jgi:hypothetical protein
MGTSAQTASTAPYAPHFARNVAALTVVAESFEPGRALFFSARPSSAASTTTSSSSSSIVLNVYNAYDADSDGTGSMRSVSSTSISIAAAAAASSSSSSLSAATVAHGESFGAVGIRTGRSDAALRGRDGVVGGAFDFAAPSRPPPNVALRVEGPREATSGWSSGARQKRSRKSLRNEVHNADAVVWEAV